MSAFADTVVVVENPYRNYTNTFDDGVYIVNIEDENESSEFSDAVARDSIHTDFELEPMGTVPVPVYRAVKKK